MIWFFLWLIFACAVFGFLGWSTNILLAQRKAWAEFAAKYKLDLEKGRKFLDPYAVSGTMNGRRLNIYTQSETSETQRTQRIFSHVEVFLNNLPPVLCVLSKRRLPSFLGDIVLPGVLTMQSPDWPAPSVAMTDDAYALANWMTPRRLKALKGFMDAAGPGEEAILISDGTQAFLFWRTEGPLRDPRQLNALMQKMFGWAKDFDSAD